MLACSGCGLLLCPNGGRCVVLVETRELRAEVERLRERLHKCDGMANEVNILGAEVTRLRAALRALVDSLPRCNLDGCEEHAMVQWDDSNYRCEAHRPESPWRSVGVGHVAPLRAAIALLGGR